MSKPPSLSRVGAALLLLGSAAAQAASFSFSGVTDSGPLAGAAFSGQFSWLDDAVPSDGELPLSSFSLLFAGQSYTLLGATQPATAVFSGGSFIGLSFLDDASTDTAMRPQVSLTPGFFSLDDAYLSYVGSGGLGGFGSYVVTSAVPEPAAWLLMALGVGAVSRRARVRAR